MKSGKRIYRGIHGLRGRPIEEGSEDEKEGVRQRFAEKRHRLEIEAEAGGESASAGKFAQEIERVQIVIAVEEV